MTPENAEDPEVETDSRFPSGPWTGFFLQPLMPGRHPMELRLTFRKGILRGEGRDRVGEFTFRGRYQVADGKCWWSKSYLKAHSLAYQGYNEGKGIWGTWEESPINHGGFHIWPVAMGDPTQARLSESVEEPAEAPATTPAAEPLAEPVPAEPIGEPVSSELGSPVGRPVDPEGWA